MTNSDHIFTKDDFHVGMHVKLHTGRYDVIWRHANNGAHMTTRTLGPGCPTGVITRMDGQFMEIKLDDGDGYDIQRVKPDDIRAILEEGEEA